MKPHHSSATSGSNKDLKRKAGFFLLITVFALLVTNSADSNPSGFRHQLRTKNLILEGRAYYGWTLDHHIEMTPFTRHYPAYEISLFKATYGKARWEFMYNYPFVGMSFWYSDLGRTSALGSGFALFPFINFPLMNREGFNFYFRLGVGLGYITKPYDRYKNYENIAIGSHINGAVNLLLEARWRMGRKFMASTGLGLMHFSNGAIKLPNYGLNIPCVTAALSYRLTRENVYLKRKLLPQLYTFEFDNRRYLNFDVSAVMGVKDMEATLGSGNTFMVYNIFGNMTWPVGYKSHFGFGLDVSYDGSDETLLKMNDIEPEHWINLVKTGLTVAYELSFSRMSIMLNMGSYLSGLDKTDGYVYEKLALRVGITKDLFGTIQLKAHYAKADFVGFGVGYRLHLKYYDKKHKW